VIRLDMSGTWPGGSSIRHPANRLVASELGKTVDETLDEPAPAEADLRIRRHGRAAIEHERERFLELGRDIDSVSSSGDVGVLKKAFSVGLTRSSGMSGLPHEVFFGCTGLAESPQLRVAVVHGETPLHNEHNRRTRGRHGRVSMTA